MNKIIIGIAITLIVLIGIAWVARPDSLNSTIPSVKSSSTLIVKEADNYDFGTISMAAGNVQHAFAIRNMGAEPVVVDKIYTSCMCTTAALMMGSKRFGPYGMPGHGFTPKVNATVNPGEEAIVEVVFDPAAHGPAGVGPVVRAVYLETASNEVLELRLSATVTP